MQHFELLYSIWNKGYFSSPWLQNDCLSECMESTAEEEFLYKQVTAVEKHEPFNWPDGRQRTDHNGISPLIIGRKNRPTEEDH